MKSRYRDSAEQASRPLSPRLGMGLGSEAGAGLQRRVLSFVRVHPGSHRRLWGLTILFVFASLLNADQQVWADPSEEALGVDAREHVLPDNFRRELIPIPMGVLDTEVAFLSRCLKELESFAHKGRSDDQSSVAATELTLQESGNRELMAMRERLQYLASAYHTMRLTQQLLFDPEGDNYLAKQHQLTWAEVEGIGDLKRRFDDSRKTWMEYKRISAPLCDRSKLTRDEEAEIYKRAQPLNDSFLDTASQMEVERQEVSEEFINQLVQHRLLSRTEANVLTCSDELKAVTRIQTLLKRRYRLPIK